MEKETNFFKISIGIFIVAIIVSSISFVVFNKKNEEVRKNIEVLSTEKSKVEKEVNEINKTTTEKKKNIEELKAKLGN